MSSLSGLRGVDDHYVAYFNALEKDSGRLRLGAAVADRVDGTYRDIGHPLVSDNEVSLIDLTFLRRSGRQRRAPRSSAQRILELGRQRGRGSGGLPATTNYGTSD